jgi:hypothetical protein
LVIVAGSLLGSLSGKAIKKFTRDAQDLGIH